MEREEQASVSAAVGRAMGRFEPPPLQNVSEWAEESRFLSSESSAEPGPWRNARAPYLQDIMDLYNDPAVREVWVMKSAQVGWTEVLNNIIGYAIDRRPGPMLLMQPTVEMVEAWSKDRLTPMLNDSPSLRAKVSAPRAKDGANTLRHKTGPGWRLSMAGANSPAGLRMRSVRDLFCDEVDGYPVSSGKDGDPISLARKRQVSFWNRKFFAGSTPTVKGRSRIEAGFESTDMRYLHLPCPHCTGANRGEPDGYQRLEWSQIKWVDNNPRTAAYLCKHCGTLIEHHHKQWMLERRRWVATKPFDGRAGIHIWEAYSPFVSWAEMVANFLESKTLPETLQTFINNSLGETWEEAGSAVESGPLLDRKEQYGPDNIPSNVLMLSVGGDTQDDRVELQLLGWGADEECWIVEQKVFRGDPGKPELWAEVDAYLLQRFTTEDGRTLLIESVAIDSGGHHSHDVYNFVVSRKRRRVWATRGVGGPGKLIWPKKASRAAKSRAMVFNLGVDAAKGVLYGRLVKITDPGPGYIHLPHEVDAEFCKQLTSEKAITRYVRGRPTTAWEPRAKGIRQEAQDCWVYGYAAFIGRRGPEIIKRLMLRRPRASSPPAQASALAVSEAAPTEQHEPQRASPEPVAVQRPQPIQQPKKPHWSQKPRRGWVKNW